MKHIKAYEAYFGEGRFCELTGAPGGDVNHIQARGLGGRKSMDYIENLMALERKAHDYFGDKKQFKEWLQDWHLVFMTDRVPMYLAAPDDPILKEFIRKVYLYEG